MIGRFLRRAEMGCYSLDWDELRVLVVGFAFLAYSELIENQQLGFIFVSLARPLRKDSTINSDYS